MPRTKDFYSILGVNEHAGADAIKKAYRKLAREYHPDRNPDKPGAEERFKEIQHAYDVLSDPQKRKQYDLSRKNPFGGMGEPFTTSGGSQYYRTPDGTYHRADSQGGASGDFFDSFSGGFTDLFSKIFGGAEPSGAAGNRPGRRAVSEAELRLTFEEALAGGKREISLPDGEKVRIDVPKGVRSGFRIRLRGYGPPAPNGRGDLLVTFEVAPDARFRREGDDLITTVAVTAFEALLGATRNVTNAYGKRIKLAVPPGTQPGDKLRLKGQGVETAKGAGDLLVEVQVSIPRDLTPEQRDAIRSAAARAGLL